MQKEQGAALSVRKADLWAGIVICIIAGGFLVSAARLPWQHARWTYYSAPGLVPALFAGVMLLMGALLIARSLRLGAAEPRPSDGTTSAAQSDSERAMEHRQSRRQVVLTAMLCLGYALLLGRVPYSVATFAFLAAFMLVFGGQKPIKVVFIASLVTVIVSGAFQYVFLIPLP